VISVTEAQLMAWLSPVLWPFFRVLAVFTAAPVFSSRVFPLRAKIGLALLVALCAQPSLQGQPVVSFDGPQGLQTLVQQVGIGLALGFAVRVVFASVELAGELIGLQMGLNFATFFDPSNNTQSSAVSLFFGHMTVLLFIVMNGHLLLLMAVVHSFDAFPVGASLLEMLAKVRLYELGADLFSSALWIALPMIAVLLLINLTLGIISRVAPQMNIFAIGFPVTLAVGLLGIALTLPMLDQPFMALFGRAIDLFAPH
jgi:flagellar biosynthetic protein FliR